MQRSTVRITPVLAQNVPATPRDVDSWAKPLLAALELAQVIARTANSTPGALRLEPETVHIIQIAIDAVTEDVQYNKGVLHTLTPQEQEQSWTNSSL